MIASAHRSGEAWSIRRADGPEALVGLLADAELPVEDLGLHDPTEFWLVEVDGEVIGGAAVERHGGLGLLRSVVVAPEWRRNGVGRRLVDEVTAAVSRDVPSLYLLTETAETFFAEMGFRRIERGAAPPPIRATSEYATVCAETAAVMVRQTPSP